MAVRDRASAVLAGLAALAIVADLAALAERPLLGWLGFAALLAPPALVVDVLARPRLPWPERLLATIAGAVALALLTGLAGALSPRGLDGPTAAVLELGALGAALLLWMPRRLHGAGSRAGERPAEPPEAEATPGARRRPGIRWDASAVRGAAEARVPATVRGRLAHPAPVSILLTLAGLGLATTGYAIAATAATTQPHPGFVQLWATPAGAAGPPSIGVQNELGGPATCDLTLVRPGEASLAGHIGTLADGASWSAGLPAATPGAAGPWEAQLSCAGPNGAVVTRRLTISPPA